MLHCNKEEGAIKQKKKDVGELIPVHLRLRHWIPLVLALVPVTPRSRLFRILQLIP
jgi:hypothetical protein